jgi:hypothetical protein
VSKILIGEANGKNVSIDLDTLLRTRLLIQANSGKGKSWLLRRLAEQLFGKVQVLIIDPEGEFATLREKFDFVLVGKGGETAAHPRIAAMTAQRLLELRACAVCDLYEMKPSERHAYVKGFLDALIDAPKNLWHPLVVIVDEAHVYCPEKGAGESEASEAVIGMATRGRKRGYCLVAATQRLGKFRKDAASELLNVAIGGTFIDIDRKRAADALGVYGQDLHPFFDEIRLLERGKFYCLGPAVSTERILVTVGNIQTTHPEAGSARHAAEPPPTPAKIRAMLPSLADLPKEAEEKAKSIADLQKQVRELKAEITKRPTEVKNVVEERIVEVPVVTKEQVQEFTVQMARLWDITNLLAAALGKAGTKPTMQQVRKVVTPPRPRLRPEPKQNGSKPIITGDLTGPEQRILNAIAWLNSIGVEDPEQTAVAFLAGYTIGGGAWGNPRGKLNTRGFVEYLPGDRIRLTDEGRSYAQRPDVPLDAEELQQRVLQRLPGPEQKLLRVLIENPEGLSNDDLAAAAGYTVGGGAYGNPRGRLKRLGLIEYRSGLVIPKPLLFLETT